MAGRLDKLDYLTLDQHLSRSFYDQLEQTLKPLEQRFGIFSLFKPEFRLFLSGYIYLHSLAYDASSLGQKIYNLKTVSTLSTPGTLNKLQLYTLGSITVLLPYVKERFSRSKLFRNKFAYFLEDAFKIGELFNFLIFLYKGRYPNFIYRILFLDCSLIEGKKRIGVDTYYVNRNLMWTSISEILSFLIQLVDFNRIGLLIKQQITSRLTSTPKSCDKKNRQPRDYQICAICGDWPNNPYHIGCKHVFCYFCIHSDFLRYGTSTHSCPRCGHEIPDVSHIKQLYMSWSRV